MPHTLRDVFQDRLTDFRDGYGFHEPNEAVGALAVTGELLELMFGPDEAMLAMHALKHVVSHKVGGRWDWSELAAGEADADWRATWTEMEWFVASSIPPFLDELHDLSAFAHYGVLPVWASAGCEALEGPQARHLRERLAAGEDSPAWVESVCEKIDRLEQLAPRRPNGSTSLGEILLTRNLARARVKLDLGQPVTIHDLALLSGVSVKRIQNAVYARTDEAPVVDKNGLISPEACEPWLAARDYHPSIWKQVTALYPLVKAWGDDIAFEASEPDRYVDDFVFVPVANDGSLFSPSLRRAGKAHDGGFTIGAKGAETVASDYGDALEQLTRMETPRWRRPNPESGNWGIVSGQTWKRIRRAELMGL